MALDRAEKAQALVVAYQKLATCLEELYLASGAEHSAAVAEDDFHTGGSIWTGQRLEATRERMKKAMDSAGYARARVVELEGTLS